MRGLALLISSNRGHPRKGPCLIELVRGLLSWVLYEANCADSPPGEIPKSSSNFEGTQGVKESATAWRFSSPCGAAAKYFLVECSSEERASMPYVYVLAAILLRLLPHPWNVTPLGAMFLFSGATFRSKRES
ncbi:MAG TPA: DUF6580 family putative transport protein, partial [Chloroflexota bacterium]|nr:DUF6580 family putative transport protein [Chloroflexota bacterium]